MAVPTVTAGFIVTSLDATGALKDKGVYTTHEAAKTAASTWARAASGNRAIIVAGDMYQG
jgi:hypothetical protein